MSFGEVKFEAFKDLSKRLHAAIDSGKIDELIEDCLRDEAAVLLELVIPDTPTGEAPKLASVIGRANGESAEKKVEAYQKAWGGYVGGTLKRGWTGGKEQNPEPFAETLPVEHGGKTFTITVENIEEYSSYVEEGHRQTPGRYVPAIGRQLVQPATEGQHFLEKAEMKLRGGAAESKVQKRVDQFLEDLFE